MKLVRNGMTVVLMVFMLTLMSVSVCFAAIPTSEIAIGGITVGSSADYVKSIYGEPDRITTTYNHALWRGKIDEYYYGDSFHIILSDDKVIWLGTTANNGLATPAGIRVGMKVSTLIDVYGNGKAHRDRYGNICDYYYRSVKSEYSALKFGVDRNGIITAIYAGSFD